MGAVVFNLFPRLVVGFLVVVKACVVGCCWRRVSITTSRLLLATRMAMMDNVVVLVFNLDLKCMALSPIILSLLCSVMASADVSGRNCGCGLRRPPPSP